MPTVTAVWASLDPVPAYLLSPDLWKMDSDWASLAHRQNRDLWSATPAPSCQAGPSGRIFRRPPLVPLGTDFWERPWRARFLSYSDPFGSLRAPATPFPPIPELCGWNQNSRREG